MMGIKELLEHSILFRGAIALIVVGVSGYSVLSGGELPGEWWAITGTVVAFFFQGAAMAQTSRIVAQAIRNGTAK